jgi:hypothetical protein
MRQPISGLWCCVFVAGALFGQTRLHIKTSATAEVQQTEPIARRGEPSRRNVLGRQHILVQLEGVPTEEAVAELERRGARFVQYVPDSGYVFSVWSDQDWWGTNLRVSRMRAQDKVSPALPGRSNAAKRDGRGALLVEFHPDVDPAEGLRIVQQEGFEVLSHPDLLANHLLIRGPLDRIEGLTAWDEVAYVFPASAELVAGERVESCPGALTALGTVGQYIATVGEGWDGPGQGSAALGYYFQALTQKLPSDQVRAEILRAMQEWSRVAALTFGLAGGPTQERTLNFLFASGSHGDSYPFDDAGGVLAHTYYPSPPNPEPIAGDLHFDNAEEWVAGPDLTVRSVDLYSVTLHELGHALGLGHSDVPGSVMYPYYRRATSLTAEDSQAILTLYAAPSATPGGNPPVDPPPTPAPLTIAIQSPSAFPLSATTSSLPISGTVSGGTGDVGVTWTTDRGSSGTAQGGRSWMTTVPLQLGGNAITIRVIDAQNATLSRTVTATLIGVTDTVAPLVKITSPAATSVLTSAASIKLTGTASDNVGVASVTWTTSTAKSGTATGTTNWTFSVPLLVGTNSIVVRARDLAGNTGWRSVSVTRR